MTTISKKTFDFDIDNGEYGTKKIPSHTLLDILKLKFGDENVYHLDHISKFLYYIRTLDSVVHLMPKVGEKQMLIDCYGPSVSDTNWMSGHVIIRKGERDADRVWDSIQKRRKEIKEKYKAYSEDIEKDVIETIIYNRVASKTIESKIKRWKNHACVECGGDVVYIQYKYGDEFPESDLEIDISMGVKHKSLNDKLGIPNDLEGLGSTMLPRTLNIPIEMESLCINSEEMSDVFDKLSERMASDIKVIQGYITSITEDDVIETRKHLREIGDLPW